jgi:hypothetical protein
MAANSSRRKRLKRSKSGASYHFGIRLAVESPAGAPQFIVDYSLGVDVDLVVCALDVVISESRQRSERAPHILARRSRHTRERVGLQGERIFDGVPLFVGWGGRKHGADLATRGV